MWLPIARGIQSAVFFSRWLVAPFLLGMAFCLLLILYRFFADLFQLTVKVPTLAWHDLLVDVLNLIDLTLTANLVLIVIFSGYETYVSKMDLADGAERPDWMGKVDFSGLKQKLMASIIAITAVALLRGYVEMYSGAPIAPAMLAWLAGLHITFVVSALLLALTDFISSWVRH